MPSLSVYDLENISAIAAGYHGYRPLSYDTWLEIRDPVRYAELRPCLELQELANFLAARPEFIDYWLRYSTDGGNAGGWYFTEKDGLFVVGRINPPREDAFSDRPLAAAHYIVRALDAVNSPQVDDPHSEFNSG
ncbi:MAG: hypothetical protein WEE89_18790 [Gemmatimonadota bacterium]